MCKDNRKFEPTIRSLCLIKFSRVLVAVNTPAAKYSSPRGTARRRGRQFAHRRQYHYNLYAASSSSSSFCYPTFYAFTFKEYYDISISIQTKFIILCKFYYTLVNTIYYSFITIRGEHLYIRIYVSLYRNIEAMLHQLFATIIPVFTLC